MFNTDNNQRQKSGFMSWLGNTANTVTGGLMSRAGSWLGDKLFGGHELKKQLEQQKALQELQIKGSKELTDYQMQKELEMWNATGPAALRQQLEDAGYSASLMYGGAGAGGGTTGGGGGAMPTSVGADSQSAKLMASLQAQAIQSEIDLKKAQANNIKADTENKSFDNEIRANIGTAEYSEQIKSELNKERVQNITDYRKAVAIMDALGGTDPEKMYALDKFGNYDSTEFSKLGKQQVKFMMDEYTELEAKIKKLNQDIKASKQSINESKANEELLKVEAEIRNFKADLSNLGLNETTVKIIELLLKAMIGGR